MEKRKINIILLIISLACYAHALDNGLVKTPPMGWLAWERFRCNIDCKNDPLYCISENLFMDVADRLVTLGLRDAGYVLVNIDDCWAEKTRDIKGRLVADTNRFPHGIEYLSEYIHKKNLKLGIYGDYGNYTCGGYPGSLGWLEMDANTFASWKVDMLKLDGCYVDVDDMDKGYPEMTMWLNKTGRPIIYSCSWPAYLLDTNKTIPWDKIGKNCNLWRLYDDIQDSWESVYTIIKYWGDHQDTLIPNAKPGQWNDPDMLIIGDFSLSNEEAKSQFALWAIWAAPLFMSNDLRTISKDALEILMNKEIIAVNQDSLGIQGRRISIDRDPYSGTLEVWARPLADSSFAVCLFNSRDDGTPHNIRANFTQIGIKTPRARVRDLYSHTELGVYTGTITLPVNIHGVRMLKVTPQS